MTAKYLMISIMKTFLNRQEFTADKLCVQCQCLKYISPSFFELNSRSLNAEDMSSLSKLADLL